MKRVIAFSKRNLLEMSRDLLSYIFCAAFPVVMLVIMTLVNETIPKESGMVIFRIDNLTGGVIIFGQTFIMLFTALQIATDRGSAFLIRLYASPMESRDFILGYAFSMLTVSVLQSLITLTAGYVISRIVGYPLQPAGLLVSVLTTLPSAVFFISLGMIFGILFNEKAAPGMCSVIISLGSFLGALWFDAEAAGGVLYKICRCLPLIYCTNTARCSVQMNLTDGRFALSLAVTAASAVVLTCLAVLLFRRKMRADLT